MSHKDTMSLNYTDCNVMGHNLCIDNKLTFYLKLSPKCFSIEDKIIKNKKKLVKSKKCC